MQSNDIAKIEKLLIAYNDELGRQYEEVMLSYPRFAATEAEQDKIYTFVQAKMQDWQNRPFACNEGQDTPVMIIAGIADARSAFTVMQCATQICDDGIPPFVKDDFRRFATDLAKMAAEFVVQIDWEELDESADYSQTAVPCSIFLNLFTEWDFREYDITFLEKLEATGKPAELITDALRRHLRGGSSIIMQKVVRMVDSFNRSVFQRTAKRDVLMLLLVEMAGSSGDTAVYRCLRNCFVHIREKVFAAICLSDLGDPRGADFLTSWLKNNYQQTDRKTAAEVLNTIAKLGGDTKELRQMLAGEAGHLPGN